MMVLSKTVNNDIDVPVWSGISWPSWPWFEDMFRDNEWRRPFKIEEYTDDDSLVVRAELPGVDPDKDLSIEIQDHELVIAAKRSESEHHDAKHLHRSEFRYGSLTRVVPIPKDVDESKIEATYKDGVLEVRVALPPTPVHESKRQIQVKRG